jgi:hypothetical protein
MEIKELEDRLLPTAPEVMNTNSILRTIGLILLEMLKVSKDKRRKE